MTDFIGCANGKKKKKKKRKNHAKKKKMREKTATCDKVSDLRWQKQTRN
jgi:hypothetical protein